MIEKKWDVYSYGDVNIDLIIPKVEKFPMPGQEDIVDRMDTCIGGGAALFTLGLGKLGLHPVFHGTIGNDCYGSFILESFKKNNIDDSLLTVSSSSGTGISISFTNENDRSFLTYRGTNEDPDLNAIDLNKVKQAKHIHITGYSGKRNHESYFNLLKNVHDMKDVTISFDLGWDETGEWYQGIYEVFPYIDVLFMNETEAIHYSRKESVIEAAKDFGKSCKLVIIKAGKRGSIAFYDNLIYEANGYQATALDTTGAGDSFNAGFVYGFLEGYSITECLRCGNGCGAMSVMAYGGNTGFPQKEELEKFIEEQERK